MTANSIVQLNSYNYARGGADAIYLNTVRLLREEGWRVSQFSMKGERNEPSEFESYFVDEIEFGNLGGVFDTLRSSMKVIWSVEAQKKLTALVAAEQPKVAHVHNIYHHISPSVLPTLRGLGVPVVMTAHDLKVACPAYKMLSKGEICERCKGGRVWNVALRSCVRDNCAASALVAVESALHKMMGVYHRHVDVMLVSSRFYADKLSEWGYDRSKILYVPNYASAIGLSPATEAGTGVAYFGRLSEEKGIATLVRAAALSGVPVTIIGSGPQEAALKALAAELRAPATFRGRLDGAALWSAVKAARATVLPSEWYENGPMSVFESYGNARMVIGADIAGIPELIENGVSGWTFPSGDAEALAARLRGVADLPDATVMEMGREGLRIVETVFTRARYLDEISAAYARAMGR